MSRAAILDSAGMDRAFKPSDYPNYADSAGAMSMKAGGEAAGLVTRREKRRD
jgi:hypothetical protein